MVWTPTEIQRLRGVDWSDATPIMSACLPVLRSLAQDKPTLQRLVAGSCNGALADLCEHYDILDKLVLHSDVAGFRIRLHVFSDGYFDRPHTHRWPYTTLILSGGYEHNLFAVSEDIGERRLPMLRPIMSRLEQVGASYTLMPGTAHSVKAVPGTVSLIVRGPAVTDSFLVTDRVTGESWWQYGAKNELPEAKKLKQMTPSRRQSVIDQLLHLGVI